MPLFESRRPRKDKGVWWDLLKLELGKPWRGWAAGPAIGVECHFVEGARKACRALFSDGKLKCAYCDEAIAARFTGYVPLWSEDGRRCLLIMGERHWQSVEKLDHLQPVKACKTRSRGQAIFCGHSAWTTNHPPLIAADAVPQDITPTLLTLWGDDALKEWCLTRVVETKATPPAKPSKPPRKIPASKVPASDQELLDRVPSGLARDVMQAMSYAEQFPALAERLAASKAPSLNGVHPPRKPK